MALAQNETADDQVPRYTSSRLKHELRGARERALLDAYEIANRHGAKLVADEIRGAMEAARTA